MIFACGISNYSVSVFHLINHAFFKALLFLSAGSVIHAMSDEQDMRKMGGLALLYVIVVCHVVSSPLHRRLSVTISFAKSIVSENGTIEFAKRFWIRDMQKDISPISLKALSFFHLPNSSGKLHASLTKVRGEDLILSFISIRLSPASAIQSDITFPPSSFDFSHLRADLAKGVEK